MRKSLNLVVGVFLFVLVFSFSGIKSEAATVEHSGSVESPVSNYTNHEVDSFTGISLYPNADPDTVYEVKLYLFYNVVFSKSVSFRNFVISVGDVPIYTADNAGNTTGSSTQHYLGRTTTVYLKGSKLINQTISAQYRFLLSSSGNITYNSMLEYRVDSITAISGDAEAAYEEGYNAGYSDGSSAGYNAGYETGYSSGSSAGYNAGYETGYSAGINSVDTQSYYDRGYQTGQAAGYSSGYESGYESGYQQAMSVIESWGADTNIYPTEFVNIDLEDNTLSFLTDIDNYAYYKNTDGSGFYRYSFTGQYLGTNGMINTISEDFNPNHVYKIILTDFYTDLDGNGVFYLDLGKSSFKFAEKSSENKRDVYGFSIGYELGNQIGYRVEGITDSESSYSSMYVYFDRLIIMDYGPIGNTQNHIANQTNDLTNGYDSTAGESASSTFADNAASYEQAESNIFTSAKSDLNNFQFYDIGSNSAVLVGLSFVASTMTAIFGAMGGLSGGAGIVLSVLFSVMLVSIVIGTYRYFVSSGKTGSSGSKKGGKG